MIMHNSAWSCQNVKQYYYDFIIDSTQPNVPEGAASHITQCATCQSDLDRLRECLQEPRSSVQENHVAAISQTLELHLSCIDRPVTCKTVKPFLPGLADPQLQITVPTPLTAHIDNCESCARDIETIRSLGLSHKQLCHLGQLFANEQSANCTLSNADKTKAIEALANFEFSNVDPQMAAHILCCISCRTDLFKMRELKAQSSIFSSATATLPCENAQDSDFFDYAIPYGIDFKNYQYVKFRETFIKHITSCPACTERVRLVHEKVNGIIERPGSGIYTVFTFKDSADTAQQNAGEYGERPIKVQVFSYAPSEQQNSSESTKNSAQQKTKIFGLNYKTLIKSAAAVASVAAVLFVLLLLLHQTRTAVASSNLSEISNTLEKAQNLYIQIFGQGETEQIQEYWVSNELNLKLCKTHNETAFWDFTKGIMKAQSYGESTTHQLSSEMKAIDSSEFVPFRKNSVVPYGSKWQSIASKDFGPHSEAYELHWTPYGTNRGAWQNIWRVYLVNQKPVKIEYYTESLETKKLKLERLVLIQYPTAEDIKTAVRQEGF